MNLLFDTNILLLPHKRKIDVFEEAGNVAAEAIQLQTLSGVVGELEALSAGGGDDAVAASVALKLVKEKNVEVLPSGVSVDDELVARASAAAEPTAVATLDKALARRLREAGVRVFTLHGSDKLAFI